MVLQLQHAVPAWFEVLLAVEDEAERTDDGEVVDQHPFEGSGVIASFGVGPALAEFQNLIARHGRTPFAPLLSYGGICFSCSWPGSSDHHRTAVHVERGAGDP